MEGEQKLCLVEPTLEIMGETLLQIQMELMGAMEDGEALAAAEEVGAEEAEETLILLEIMEEMEVSVEREVMEAAAEAGAMEGRLVLREQEVREVLAVLEEGAELVAVLGVLSLVEAIMVVMAQQEAMAEEGEKVGLLVMREDVMVAVALAALD